MAATKYQVLYRYINEATNTAITNSMDNAYEPVCEFYTDPDHKIFSKNPTVQADAVNAQQEMISYGNSSTNPKTNMLFAYDGTKKIKHQKWIEETTGYVVRDYTLIKRSSIGNQGDFSKEFTTLNAATPEDGGLVVCTKAVFDKYFPYVTLKVVNDNSLADMGTASNPYYSETRINNLIKDATFFSLNTSGYADHCSPSKTLSMKTTYYGDYATYFTGPVAIGGNAMTVNTGYGGATIYGQSNNNNLYGDVTITEKQIETTTIPGHYEDVVDAPYLIKDTYKRIKLSPWFVNYTCCSLEAAITKARVLVDMLGMENVKLIKLVPFDQFVKIK
jgi:hypothetical protein